MKLEGATRDLNMPSDDPAEEELRKKVLQHVQDVKDGKHPEQEVESRKVSKLGMLLGRLILALKFIRMTIYHTLLKARIMPKSPKGIMVGFDVTTAEIGMKIVHDDGTHTSILFDVHGVRDLMDHFEHAIKAVTVE